MTVQELNNELGNIDIYLLDQILKGRYLESEKVLDAGCGEGRNSIWFLRNNFKVYGIDKNASAIRMLQFIARSMNPSVSKENFKVCSIEDAQFSEAYFDAIICSAVLHFAENEEHFFYMFDNIVRMTVPLGSIFIRMASNIGAEATLTGYKNKQSSLPDGSERFLLTREILENILNKYPLKLVEPVKTVNVQDSRYMTTLVFVKSDRMIE